MNTYTTKEFINFVQIVNCMSFETFKKMYENVFGYVSDGYVQEKFNLMCSGFERWICGIDYDNLEKMINFSLKKVYK